MVELNPLKQPHRRSHHPHDRSQRHAVVNVIFGVENILNAVVCQSTINYLLGIGWSKLPLTFDWT